MANINFTEEQQDLIMKALNNYQGDREDECISEEIFEEFREIGSTRTKIVFSDPQTSGTAKVILRGIFEGEIERDGEALIFCDRHTALQAVKILRSHDMTIPEEAIKAVN